MKIAEEWLGVDRSHRKLAHRGSRLEAFYASESMVLRVLRTAGIQVVERPPRERRPRREWPQWAELVPGVITIYDFTHSRGLPSWCAIAVLDMVSRYWLATVVSAEEGSTQVEVAYSRAGPCWARRICSTMRRSWPSCAAARGLTTTTSRCCSRCRTTGRR